MFSFNNFSRFNVKDLQLMVQPGKLPQLSNEEKEAVYGHARGQMTHLLQYVSFMV